MCGFWLLCSNGVAIEGVDCCETGGGVGGGVPAAAAGEIFIYISDSVMMRRSEEVTMLSF